MIYSELERLKTKIENMGYYNKVHIGSDFTALELNFKHLPLAVIKAGSGDVSGYVHGKIQVHFIGLFYKQSGIEELVLNKMETMILELADDPALNPATLSFVLDSNVFDIFGEEVPVSSPYGAFRLTYKLYDRIEQ